MVADYLLKTASHSRACDASHLCEEIMLAEEKHKLRHLITREVLIIMQVPNELWHAAFGGGIRMPRRRRIVRGEKTRCTVYDLHRAINLRGEGAAAL